MSPDTPRRPWGKLDPEPDQPEATSARPVRDLEPLKWTTTSIDDVTRHPVPEAFAERLVTNPSLPNLARERHRRLAVECLRGQADGIKVVMITSAVEGEGKTLTAANLALMLSQSTERSVLLIDADLRRPSLHRAFGVEEGHGLTDMVAGGDSRLLQVAPRLSLLVSGGPSRDPLRVLSSDQMHALVAAARERFDWVIVDTPPAATLPDTPALAPLVDAGVFIVAAGHTDYRLVQETMEALSVSRIGVVLNRVDEQDIQNRSYYGYYSAVPPASTVGIPAPDSPSWWSAWRRWPGVFLIGFFLLGLVYALAPTVLPSSDSPEAIAPDASVEVTQPGQGPPVIGVPDPVAPTLAQPEAADRASTPVEVTPTTSSGESDGLRVTLTAKEECWVRVHVDDDEAWERLMGAGQTIVVNVADQVTVRVGDAAALSMLINDRSVKPLGAPGQVVNLRITPSNYQTFLY